MSTTTSITVDELILMRDVHAGAMQLIANWDAQAETYGQVRMGLEPISQMW